MPTNQEKQFFAPKRGETLRESRFDLESQKDLDIIIKNSLAEQLKEMTARRPDRNDIKYRILADFVSKLKNQPFKEIFSKLSPAHKHAIITRLENEARHFGGKVPYDFIKKLEQDLYGVVDVDGKLMVDFSKKVELEKQLQTKNDYPQN